MGAIFSIAGAVVVLGLAYLGLKLLINTVAKTTVDTVISLFVSPIFNNDASSVK